MPYKKKAATTKKKRRTSRKSSTGYVRADNDAKKQLAVMRYPHSKATLSPKIPDGAAMLTSGLRYQGHIEHTFATEGIMLFLYPGLSSFVAVYPETNGAPAQTPAQLTDVMTSARHVWQGTAVNTKHKNEAVQRWRTVSTGVRIRCVNNDDNNDGSWEAIRVTTPIDAEEYLVNRGAAPNPIGVDVLIRRSINQIPGLNWAQNNTYTSGALKEIHKRYFMLKESQPTHEFVNMRGENYVYNGGALGAWLPLNNTNSDQIETSSEFVRQMNDLSMDTIVIWMKGKTGAENATKIIIDAVNNIEFEYYEKSGFAGFHHECASAPRAVQSTRTALRKKLIRSAC